MQEMTLREICNIVGVSRRAVQGYEESGLVISSGKNKYGYLLYDEAAVEKIRCIKQYQDFGFTVKEIKVLMTAADEVYVEMMANRVELMNVQLNNLVANIGKAERMIAEKSQYKENC